MSKSIRTFPSEGAMNALEITSLKILMLEDNPSDAELVQRALKKLPVPFTIKIVDTREAFIQALKKLKPNLILSDHSLPAMSSTEALLIYHEMNLKIPFILVTGTVSEEFAVESIKSGADDYILKDNLYRLPSAIMGALQKRKSQLDKEIAEERFFRAERIAKLGNWEWDLETDEVFWSEQIYRILGLDPASNKPSYQLFMNCVHPDDRQLVLDAIARKEIKDGDYNLDHRIVLPNGEIRFVNEQADVSYNEEGKASRFIGTLHDITERKLFEQQLDTERKFLQAVLENINVGVVACNPDGEISFFNESLRIINNLPPEYVPYNKWSNYFTVCDPETQIPAKFSELPLQKALIRGEKIMNNEFVVIPNQGGSVRKVTVNAQPLFDREGNKLGAVSAIHDCTDLKQSEEKLRNKIKELDIFIYKASHDLKGPLSSMAGLINLAKLELSDPVTLNYIGMLEQSNRKLENILTDLFEVAHITQGKTTVTEINLEEITWDVINSLKNLPNCDLIRFETKINFKNPFFSDEKLLRGILQNLIHNSINYRNADNASFILINAFEQNNRFVIEVSDNGIGIQEELKNKVFDMFFRGNYSSSGSGLGLYIVKNAVEKLKGTIDIRSVYRQGSSFVLSFPEMKPDSI